MSSKANLRNPLIRMVTTGSASFTWGLASRLVFSSARSFTMSRKVIGTVAAMTCYEIIQVPTVRQLSLIPCCLNGCNSQSCLNCIIILEPIAGRPMVHPCRLRHEEDFSLSLATLAQTRMPGLGHLFLRTTPKASATLSGKHQPTPHDGTVT